MFGTSRLHLVRLGVSGALLVLVAGALAFAGCSVATTGQTQVLNINEPSSGTAVTDVKVTMGAGKLTIGPGASGLVSGTISYNVKAWQPTVQSAAGSVVIKQNDVKSAVALAKNVVNDWNLRLGSNPMRLSVTAGAYEGQYNLGGLNLQSLSIKDGASKSTVDFSSPNAGQMDSLTYETGASKVTMRGLGNANFKTMSFKGGAGSYVLDFTGALKVDSSVKIDAGVGSLEIAVAAGTNVQVQLKGALTSVSTEGVWQKADKTYSLTGSGPSLSIAVSMSVGSLKLVAK